MLNGTDVSRGRRKRKSIACGQLRNWGRFRLVSTHACARTQAHTHAHTHTHTHIHCVLENLKRTDDHLIIYVFFRPISSPLKEVWMDEVRLLLYFFVGGLGAYLKIGQFLGQN